MAVQKISGTVRTFIPHVLRKMPTAKRLQKIMVSLHKRGKVFAINVDSSKSDLISQINLSKVIAQQLVSQLHELGLTLKIGTTVVLLAKPLGLGQMDAVKFIQVGQKSLSDKSNSTSTFKESNTSKYRNDSSTTQSLPKSSLADSSKASSSSQDSILSEKADVSSSAKHTVFSSTVSSEHSSYSAVNSTLRITKKLDSLTSSSNVNSEQEIASMYHKLENSSVDVKDIPKQLNTAFGQEHWTKFLRSINKHAGSDFDRIVNNPYVNKTMNYAMASNHIPRNLDKHVKPKVKKRTTNHKDVF